MGSESSIYVFKTCCVVPKSVSKSLKKLRLKVRLDGENASLNAEWALTIISNVYVSFSTEFWKNMLWDLHFWRLRSVNKPNLLNFYKNILRGFHCIYRGGGCNMACKSHVADTWHCCCMYQLPAKILCSCSSHAHESHREWWFKIYSK